MYKPSHLVIDGHNLSEAFPTQIKNTFYDFGVQVSLTPPPAGKVDWQS